MLPLHRHPDFYVSAEDRRQYLKERAAWKAYSSGRNSLLKVLLQVLAVLVAVMVITLALVSHVKAASMPFKQHFEQNIDNHQVGFVDLAISAEGEATITSKFSNGKQWSGNNFYSVTQLFGKNGKEIKTIIQQKGLDGSWGGRAREGSVTDVFKLTQDEMDMLDRVVTRMGTKYCGLEVTEMKDLNDWHFQPRTCSGAPEENESTRPEPFMWRFPRV